MTPALILSNLGWWGLESAVLIAAAALAARLLVSPNMRLRFWQAVIVAALLLPVAGPWKKTAVVAPVADTSVSITMHTVGTVEDAGPSLPTSAHVIELLAAGAALRLLWLAAGCFRLRRMRRQAKPLAMPLTGNSWDARGAARWFESAAITGPVTFGWLRPSILLPETVLRLPEHQLTAIACHELVHVRRRDWIFVIAEEVLRSLLWFHPAIWYALSQVQLAREHSVDRETVALTQDRSGYLDALLAVAAHKLQPDVAPAPLFLRKRQLASRLHALVKETNMSASRLIARGAAAISAAALAAVLAVWMFPLVSPAQVVLDDPGVTVDAGGTLLHRMPVHVPVTVTNGSVLVEATLNSKGEVSDARVLSGPDELRKPVLTSVLEWHYSADAAPPTVHITVQVSRSGVPAIPPPPPPPPPPPGVAVRSALAVKGGLPPSAAQWAGTIGDIRYVGIGDALQKQIESRLPVRKGDRYTPETNLSVLTALVAVDEHLRLTVRASRDNGDTDLEIALPAAQAVGFGGVGGRGGQGGPPSAALFSRVAQDPVNAREADVLGPDLMRVGGNLQSQNLITKVTPAYPPLAKQARIQGTVTLSVAISKEGTVGDIHVISGHPLLVPAATDAVKQWVYKPTLFNGSPTAVLTEVNINFTLSQ